MTDTEILDALLKYEPTLINEGKGYDGIQNYGALNEVYIVQKFIREERAKQGQLKSDRYYDTR